MPCSLRPCGWCVWLVRMGLGGMGLSATDDCLSACPNGCCFSGAWALSSPTLFGRRFDRRQKAFRCQAKPKPPARAVKTALFMHAGPVAVLFLAWTGRALAGVALAFSRHTANNNNTLCCVGQQRVRCPPRIFQRRVCARRTRACVCILACHSIDASSHPSTDSPLNQPKRLCTCTGLKGKRRGRSRAFERSCRGEFQDSLASKGGRRQRW